MRKKTSENIKDDDLLGRAVFSSRRMKRAKKGFVDFHAFFRKGSNNISVDRFGFCSDKTLTKIQNKNAKLRVQDDKCSFYGWLQMTVNTARGVEKERTVKATPTQDNPYHADIVLPNTVTDDFERKAHAKEIASNKSIKWICSS